MSVEQLAQRIRDILGPYNDDHESLQNLISNLVLKLDEHESSLQGKVLVDSLSKPDYAYKTIGEYEELSGFQVSTAFKSGWDMARTTNKMLGLNAASQEKCDVAE